MNIVYACDNNFAEMLGISMVSLFENNKNCGEINVYILDDEISDTNKNKLKKIADKYDRRFVCISVRDVFVPEKLQSEHWSKSAFTRIYLRVLLPENVKKVLYLDCDTIIRTDLCKLYEIDIENYTMAGVCDCVSKLYLRNIDLKETALYCNSGVLLINLDRWDEKEFMTFLEGHINYIKYPDQDVINGVCSKKMRRLDIGYNCYTAVFDFTYENLLKFRKPPFFYSKDEVEAAKNNPAIVHFTTSFLSLRPWVEGCGHPFVNEWLKYKKMSPWADAPLRKDSRSGKMKFAVKVYNRLPEPVAVVIAGILHAKIVPMLKRFFYGNTRTT